MILGKTDLGDGWRFGLSLIVGIIFGGFAFYLWNLRWINHLSILSIVLAIISILLWIIPDRIILNKIGVDSIFDKSISIDLEQSLKDEKENKHDVIFIFDKTAYAKTDVYSGTPIASALQNAYDNYFSTIKDNIYSDIKRGKKDSYRDFCRIKLCADLLSLKDKKGTFSIFSIENDFDPIIEKKTLKTEYIKDAIIQLNTISYVDNRNTETDFKDVYNSLCNVISDENILHIRNFPKFSLYVYSDFIHDKTYQNKSDMDNDFKLIKNAQKKLDERDVVQNLFVIPHAINKEQQKYILNEQTDKPQYKNINKLENYQFDLDESDNRNHRVKYLKDIPLYADNNGKCSPNLYFPRDKHYSIRLKDEKSLKEGQELFLLINGEEKKMTEKSISITSEKVSIVFIGNKPTNESQIFLDIAQEGGLHGFNRLDFKDTFPEYLKYLLPIICFLSGIWVAVYILSLLKNYKVI
jgi:hypothetical protein